MQHGWHDAIPVPSKTVGLLPSAEALARMEASVAVIPHMLLPHAPHPPARHDGAPPYCPDKRCPQQVQKVMAQVEKDEDALSRCIACARYFPSRDPTDSGKGCCFHPGSYRHSGTTLSTGFFTGWSCCKDLNERATGCQVSPGTPPDRDLSGGESMMCR